MMIWPAANAIYRRETYDNYPAAKAILLAEVQAEVQRLFRYRALAEAPDREINVHVVQNVGHLVPPSAILRSAVIPDAVGKSVVLAVVSVEDFRERQILAVPVRGVLDDGELTRRRFRAILLFVHGGLDYAYRD
jgi:hypothetical protein